MFKFIYRRKMIDSYWRVVYLKDLYGKIELACIYEKLCKERSKLHFYMFKCGALNEDMFHQALFVN